MKRVLEYIDVNCGNVQYYIIKGKSRYHVMCVQPYQKMHQFARTNTLNLAYEMVQSHLRGRYQCAFSKVELIGKSSDIQVGDFQGIAVV